MEPPPPTISGFGLISISMFWLATNLHWTALIAVLMPIEVAKMAGKNQASALGLLFGLGAVFALVVPLVVGPLSDRCTSALGRRRPFMIWGVLINLVGLAIMAFSFGTGAYLGFAAAYLVINLGNNIACGAYNGVIPDVVPIDQRGVASGYMGTMSQFGAVIGIVLVGIVFRADPLKSYIFIGIALILFLLWTAAGLREQRLAAKPPPIDVIAFVRGLWINPFEFRDFAWVWITRFLVMLGFYAVVPFLTYYLRDIIHIHEKDLPVTEGAVFLVVLLAATITGVVGGWLSDRIGRKSIVYWANGIMAVTAVAFMFCQSLMQVIVVGAIFGLGYGAYISVDWALGTDVLPNKEEAGKDMAVWHIAMVLPQTIAGPIAGYFLGRFGYTRETLSGKEIFHYPPAGYLTVFCFSAVALSLGAIFLRNVRGAK